MTESIQAVETNGDVLKEAAVDIFLQAKDAYFKEASILSSKRAELDRVESMAVTLRGQIAEREALIGGMKEHMHETFAFAREELERRA